MKSLRIVNPKGSVDIIASKSELHRLLFIAVLRNKYLKINNPYYSDDIKNTISVLTKCGATIITNANYIEVFPSKLRVTDILDCGESGTTLRFLIPFVCTIGGSAIICGKNKLVDRPISEYFNIFDKCNIKYKYNNRLPLEVSGRLLSGDYMISGSRSSQFISALLIALSFLKGKSTLLITDKLESKSYVDMTINILKIFNINIVLEDNKYIINPYTNDELTMVKAYGDYSQATFFLVMNALGANISLGNISNNSLQGDIKILDYLKESGVIFDENFRVIKNDFKPLDINLNDNPDLAPALALYACFLKGKSYIRGLDRLKYKESDRFKAICDMFDNMGVNYSTIDDNTIIVYGPNEFKDTYIDVKNDHRILFTASILSMFTKVSVDTLAPANKSYPTYFDEYIKLGGTILDE